MVMVTGVGWPGATSTVTPGPATLKSSIVKLLAVEVPPPGAGLVTVTLTVPPRDMALAGITAVSCVALTKVVVSILPLKLTVEVETKPKPLMVSVKPVPAGACDGERLPIDGTELLTVSVSDGLVMPPSEAVICDVPVATPVARPVLAPMVATDGLADAQATLTVMFCVELSLYVPVAVNCCVDPTKIEGFAGVSLIETSVTVIVSVPVASLAW
jgi:hypothetical protein